MCARQARSIAALLLTAPRPIRSFYSFSGVLAAVSTRNQISSACTPSSTGIFPAQRRTHCTMGEDFNTRAVDKVILSRKQSEGVGATVRRSIGGFSLRSFDPFLLLDEFDVGKPAGFPDHPHRGFETVTYMLKGYTEHEDSCGHRGKIGPGSLQWMTAGKGIVHSEMPFGDENGHGLQLWVNLRRSDKMCQPAYQELNAEDIPSVTKQGVTATVIAGKALGASSPVQTRTPTYYIHFKMEPGSELKQPIPKDMNAFLYILGGRARIGGGQEGSEIEAHNTVTLTKSEEESGILVKTSDSPADFVLICGEPLNEPVVQHGPFVMNTQEEIQQAIMDYQLGRNGFENASTWYSEIGLPITQADRHR
ncbi:unnamed protein product [Discosporangium mesarthrocarpum]